MSLSGVGIKQNETKQVELKLFPNPSDDQFYIEFPSSQKDIYIEVYDILGKLVRGAKYNESGNYIQVPVSDLNNGVYLVRVQYGTSSNTLKFIKQ